MATNLEQFAQSQLKNTINNLDVCAYNVIYTPGHDDTFNTFIDDTISIFDSLFGFAATLGAFQFVGIVFEKSVLEESESLIMQLSYFFLAIGFLVSILGAMIVFISRLYVRSLRHETKMFAIAAIKKNTKLFYFGYITLFMNSAAFLVPINLLVHELLGLYYAIVINIISGAVLIIGISTYVVLLFNKQIFTIDDIEYKRRIYI